VGHAGAVNDPRVNDSGAATEPGRAGGWLRTLSGLLAGGLVVLAVVLTAAWFVADRAGSPGPGVDMLIWHGVAAVAAVLAQRVADRRSGPVGWIAVLAVLTITAVVLAVQWLV
jgi:hypothetical protein